MVTAWGSERGWGSCPTTAGGDGTVVVVTGFAVLAVVLWAAFFVFGVGGAGGAGIGGPNCCTVATVLGEPPPKT